MSSLPRVDKGHRSRKGVAASAMEVSQTGGWGSDYMSLLLLLFRIRASFLACFDS